MLLDLINPYALVMKARRDLYRRNVLSSFHPGIPVISIGNLTMGGTGKSPLTIQVAKYICESLGKQVAVVSRGYRRKSKGYLLVRDRNSILASVDASGDEAQMIARQLPEAIMIVDEDRAHGAQQAMLLGAEAVILDDGYQHLSVQRDLNILLIDASRPLSQVLPFGQRREPLSAMKDADVVVFTNSHSPNTSQTEKVRRRLNPSSEIATSHVCPLELIALDGTTHSTDLLSEKRVLAVSAIAGPERFERLLHEENADVISYRMRDHADFDSQEFDRIWRRADQNKVDMIVTTEKDIVKSRMFFQHSALRVPVYILRVTTEFLTGKEDFYSRIDELF